jgi:hypothetical protein
MRERPQTRGRTGRRRLTPAELALRDRKAQRQAEQRYSTKKVALGTSPLGDPPPWFNSRLQEIWQGIANSAPSGVLTAADHPAVITYAMAIYEYQRLAERAAVRKTPAPPEQSRQLRLLGNEMRAAGTYLGLSLAERARLGQPEPPPEPDTPDRWGELRHFPTLGGGGRNA